MISNPITGIDTKGAISQRINLANEEGLDISQMISLISGGNQAIGAYLNKKKEEKVRRT